MNVETRERGRLFERPSAPRPLRLTARDFALLTNLVRLRLASAEQLAALDGGSPQNVSRALLTLWEHGYVDRLLGQLEMRLLYKGSFPLIYGLTRPGGWLLRKHGYDAPRRLLYETDKQRRAGWRFIKHRVDISEFMVRLELACRDRADVELVCRSEILDSAHGSDRDRRVRLAVKAKIGGKHKVLSVDPDEMFGLRNTATGRIDYFMFERDRGEMPVQRYKSQDQTFFAKKMLTYLEANRVGAHITELGIPNFRVLTVTTTPEHVEQMIEAQLEISGSRGSNIFLFADEASLVGCDPLSVGWLTGKGERRRLVD